MVRRFLAAGLALVLLAAAACRRETESGRVLAAVDVLARLAEKKDLEAFLASVEAGYADSEGRDKEGLRALLSGYLSGRTGIVVHRLGGKVDFPEADRAELQSDFALSAGAAQALRRLVRLSPDLYRVNVELVRAGGHWLVHYAEWRAIGLTEVFPESLRVLESLFPNLGKE